MWMRRLLRRLRLIDMKLQRRRIGEWQREPVMRDGIACAWMLTEQGEYAYRPMSEDEALDWLSNESW